MRSNLKELVGVELGGIFIKSKFEYFGYKQFFGTGPVLKPSLIRFVGAPCIGLGFALHEWTHQVISLCGACFCI